MKRIIGIIIILSLIQTRLIYGQAVIPTPLALGEKCPNLEFSNLVNTSISGVKLSDYKGKLVILDFWATWCGACVKALPKLNKLQKKYQEEIVILPITYQDRETVKTFLDKREASGYFGEEELALTMVVNDSAAQEYFPHKLLPHTVWLDKSANYITATKSDMINETTIEKYLSEDIAPNELKKDLLEINMNLPLLFGGLGKSSPDLKSLKYSSLFLEGKIDGLASFIGYQCDYNNIEGTQELTKVIAANHWVQTLYKVAFIGPRKQGVEYWDFPNVDLKYASRLLWEAKDSTLYNWPGRTKESWDAVPDSLKWFSFEMVAPLKDSTHFQLDILNELNRYFGNTCNLEGKVEKRKVRYWALMKSGKSELFKSNGGNLDFVIDKDEKVVRVKNYSLKTFLFYWLSFHAGDLNMPVINETGYDGLVSFEFSANSTSMESMNNGLKEFGLQLKLKEGYIDMIVIKDKDQ